ncbi:MAG TPA: cobalamin biosynthesis protein P47K, partial [Schlesneria sp.]
RDLAPELSLPSQTQTRDVDLVVNARVACDPDVLGRHVEATVREVCAKHAATPTFGAAQMFRPGRPQPTHRMTATT